MGIKVVVMAFLRKPTSKLVAVKAIKKVSVSIPDPNFAAIRISLKKPKNLLPRVNIIIIKPDLAICFELLISLPPMYCFYTLLYIYF